MPEYGLRAAAACLGAAVMLSACAGHSKTDGAPADSGRTSTSLADTSGHPSSGQSSTSSHPGGSEADQAVTTTCPLIGAEVVESAFGAKVSAVRGSVSGTGNPVCTFTLASSNLGGARGVVVVGVVRGMSLVDFAGARKSTPGAVHVSGVGFDAYYVPGSSSLQFVWNNETGAVDAEMKNLPASQKSRLRDDIVAVAKAMASH